MAPSASPSAPAEGGGVTKVLVAIHGIGSQTAYATVQSVAAQLGNYYDIGAPIPLGRFYKGTSANGPAPTQVAAINTRMSGSTERVMLKNPRTTL